ncbi:discoidin domain-containing protein [Paenibacillus albidus]|nr:discoidin domain-containing protein [Paenibacillus albidus]
MQARYVRMYGTERATQYGYSLWEFEVYGPE